MGAVGIKPHTAIDDEFDPPVDYLALHESDGDTWDMFKDIEHSRAEEE